MQKPMLRVCYALIPLVLASVWLFGWRCLGLTLLVFVFGIATEALFNFRTGQPVTSAVFVTCLIFTLSLPPTLPFYMAVLGIIFGVAIGKMVFGGFGRNVFNPAMVGRCFIYITFPLQMTGSWVSPIQGHLGGLVHWANPVDAVTRATPLVKLRLGEMPDPAGLFFGQSLGSMGETSALLIILGGLFLIYKKAAPWRLAVSCLLGGIILSGVLHWAGFANIPAPWFTVLAGSFLFGSFFVVTEPVTGPNNKEAQWIYGFFIGALTVVLRGFSNFSEGIMFSVLIMNACVPLLDQTIGSIKKKKKAAPK